VNPPGSRFCNGCGHNLTQSSEPPPKDLSFEEKIEKIQKYLPKGLTDKILSQRDKIEGERKLVTVLFADLEGFTPLVEKIGPEEAYSIMDQVYEILIHKVHDYEGTVNEMKGDGIIALYGAPIALEDAPQRAIRSAYSIHREMVKFSDKMKQEREGIPPLKMRIGIHTGPVVVGTLGNDLRVEFKVVGDTVNLASRMEDLAEPGATYVTEETFKLTEGLFRFESLGEKEVKGKEKPVKTYRVIGPSTRRTRFDVSAEKGLTPLVGRERELELLLDGFERTKQGQGQAFSIMAEAGIGKSRLLYEFRKAVENEDVTFLEGKCLSYSQGVAYHPIIDLYKANFDIRDDDADYEIKDKVIKGLKQLDVDEASSLPYLLELLSVKDSGIDQILLSPEGKKDRMIETMIRIPLKGSQIRPLIMVIEDLHWMDKSSEEVLKYLLESISGERILLIFTYRPEFVYTWGGRSYHNQVNLNRLSNSESLVMVNHLLDAENIESDLENLILEKTEGIPFYIEEFLKSFKDLNVIERKDNRYHLIKDIKDLSIPATIQDVIMARVDSLPDGAKEVLLTGSAIEREFSYDLVRAVTGLTEQELMSHFSVLRDSELLYERGIYPQSTYIFKHALTREVVYDSILARRKKKLHNQIGTAIEEADKDTLHEYSGRLANHFIEGENYEKGAEYNQLAAIQADRKPARIEAISFGEKAVFCYDRLPQTDALQKNIIDARTNLANYYMNLYRFIEAKDAVAPVKDLAEEMNYQRGLARIYNAIGYYLGAVEEDLARSLEYLDKALKLAEKTKDRNTLWLANLFKGGFFTANCEFEKALDLYQRALDVSAAVNNEFGVSWMKGLMVFWIYTYRGELDLAYQTGQEALELAKESGDIFLMANPLNVIGTTYYLKGLPDKAEDYLLKAVINSEKQDNIALGSNALGKLGNLFIDRSEFEKAQHYYEKAISLAESIRYLPSFTNLYKIGLARARVLNKERDVNLNELFGYEKSNKYKLLEGLMARDIGDILLNIDDQHMSEAENWIKKAIEANERNGTRGYLGFDYLLYAELFKRKGDQPKAEENLNKAIEILKECGADGWVKKYEKELAAIS
jgi:predicted ATPase/class 3 adenylate cyclase